MRMFSIVLFIAQGLLLSQIAHGQTPALPAILLDNSGQISLNGHIEYLEDKEGILTIDEVAVSRNFIDAGEDAPNFGFTDSVYWFQFSITNHTSQSALLLEQGYTHIDHISLYAPNSEGGFKEQQSGDMLPFKNRARDYRTITFEIQIEPGATRLFFVRTQSTGSTQLPLKVYKESTFAQVSEREAAALGAFYGIILVMIVFNTLLWMSLRDKTYLSYVGYLAFYLIFQLTLNGNALRYIFPESPNLNAIALPFSVFTAFFFGFRFTREFMNLENILPKASRAIIWVERILLASAIASILVPYAIIIKPMTLITVLAPFSFLILGVACVRKGYKPARTYLTAWSIFLFGILVFGLKTFGILPSNAFTEFSIQVGSTLEVTLLSLALADRIHIIQAERELALAAEAAAHYSLAESYQALHVELERRKVAEETLALELKARNHLVAEAAHRLNNPLNISLGGVGMLEEKLKEHMDKLQTVFNNLEPESDEEVMWLAGVQDDLHTMQSASGDAHQALCRANDFLAEFRAVGGLRGARNSFVSIMRILERAQARIQADTGKHTSLSFQLENAENTMVWSNEYVAALLLSYTVSTMIACECINIGFVQSSIDTHGKRFNLILQGESAGILSANKDLIELSPVQLAEAVGNKSPRMTQTQNDSNIIEYLIQFECQPPQSLVEQPQALSSSAGQQGKYDEA
jgi:signal transduction histidine kinase